MGIKGFQGTSLLDFPGRVASLVFWGGCNLTCPFCHNPALVLDPAAYPDIEPDDLLEDLRQRQPFIDGVVVSGGEPTMHRELVPFLEQVKRLGLAVKLDTNGLAPDMVAALLDRQLIDYLAIDLKTSLERYAALHPGPVVVEKLRETIRVARDGCAVVEFRTTCVPGWVDEEVVRGLGQEIEGGELWTLQQFHPQHALDDATRELEAYPNERIGALADVAAGYVREVVVRGI